MQITDGIQFTGGLTLQKGPSNSESGLIVYLDAGSASSYSGSGGTWYDLSGKGNDFTLIDSTPYTSSNQLSYFSFSSGIAQSTTAILPTQAYTKIAIFRVAGGFGNIISGGVTNYDHAFWGAGSQYLYSGHNGNWTGVGSSRTVPTNEWVFGAVTFNTDTGWKLYLNDDSPVTYSDTSAFSDLSIVEIGGFAGNANNMGGDVAVAKIYDRVLSDSEIAAQYSQFRNRFN
jgi:hypothetical protein